MTPPPSPEAMAREAQQRGVIGAVEMPVYMAAVAAERERAFVATLDLVAPGDGGPTEHEAPGWDRPHRYDARRGCYVLGGMREAYAALPGKARALIERVKLATRERSGGA